MDIILLSFNMNKNNSENNQLLQWIIETRVKIQSNTCKEKSIHPRKVKRGYNLDQKARAIPKGEVSPVPGIFHEAPPSSSIPFCSIPTSFDDWNVTLHAISIIRGRPNCCINPLTCEERERERVEKESARRDDGSMPSPGTNRLFVSLDASLFAVFTPSNCLVSNRGIKSDSNRLPFTSSISLPFLSRSLSLSELFTVALIFLPANPIHGSTMNDRDVRSTSPPDSLSLLKFVYCSRFQLSLSIRADFLGGKIQRDSFGLLFATKMFGQDKDCDSSVSYCRLFDDFLV